MSWRRWMLLLIACPWVAYAETPSTSQTTTDLALRAADQAVQQAGAAGVQWTSTLALLKAAQVAAKAGQFATAQQQAAKAEAMAKLSLQEAREQARLWRAEVIQ